MKYLFLHILFTISCFAPVPALSQYLNIEIEVVPEVETVVEQSLDFGQIITNSGLREIEMGHSNMGIFKLNALRTHSLIISLDADKELTHTNPAVDSSIPLHLQARYSDNGVNDIQNSVPLTRFNENIFIKGSPQNPLSAWSAAYIYIYGSLEIGNIPAGEYRGSVILTVVYE